MIEILEGIARDESVNPTARVTSIRALRQIEQDRGSDELADELERRSAVAVAIGSSATATWNAVHRRSQPQRRAAPVMAWAYPRSAAADVSAWYPNR